MGLTLPLPCKNMPQLYRGGEVSPFIHSIDLPGWIKQGWSETPIADQLSGPEAIIPPSLALINSATGADGIKVLPGVGSVSARLIFDSRPIDGYGCLEDVAAVEGLPNIDWDEVGKWQGP